MKQTQEQWVKAQLLDKGSISRNEALRNYISRLGAITFDLREQGLDIEGTWVKTEQGRDYVYTLKTRPTKRVQHVEIVNGVAILSYKTVPV